MFEPVFFSEIMTHVRLFLVPHHLGVGFLRLFNAKQSELLRTILPVLDLVSSTVAQTKVSPKQLPPSRGTVTSAAAIPGSFCFRWWTRSCQQFLDKPADPAAKRGRTTIEPVSILHAPQTL